MKNLLHILAAIIFSSIFVNTQAGFFEKMKGDVKKEVEQLRKKAAEAEQEAEGKIKHTLSELKEKASQALTEIRINVDAAKENGRMIHDAIEKIPGLISQVRNEINGENSALARIQNIMQHVNEFVPAIKQLLARLGSSDNKAALFQLLTGIAMAIETSSFDATKLGISLTPQLQQELKADIDKVYTFLKQVHTAASQIDHEKLFATLTTTFDKFATLFSSVAHIRNNLGALGHLLMTPDTEATLNQMATNFSNLKNDIAVFGTGPAIEPKAILKQFVHGIMTGIDTGKLETIVSSLVASIKNSIAIIQQNMGAIEQFTASLTQLNGDLVAEIYSLGNLRDHAIQAAMGASSHGADIVTTAIQTVKQEGATIIAKIKSDISNIAKNAQGLITIIHTVVDQALKTNQTLIDQVEVVILSEPKMAAMQNMINSLQQIITTIAKFAQRLAQLININE